MPICPTCHTSVDELITQPSTNLLQSITPPTDMSGVLPAVQQLVYNFNMITGNGPSRSGGGGQGQGQGQNGKKGKKPRFEEQLPKRITKQVRVYSKQDKEVFVEYKQINGMTFQDTVTKELWVWNRGI
jgi:hypothetical protein